MQRTYKIFNDFEIVSRERLGPMKDKFEKYLKEQQEMIKEMRMYHQKELEIEKSVLEAR